MSTIDDKKTLVLQAFDTLFNKRDYDAAEKFWSPAYIQHSAHIAPGREGLFDLVRSLPAELHYENALMIAEGDYVFLHGRFTGSQPRAMIAADIVRIADGVLAEHWDVLQDEGTKAESKSGLPMFVAAFAQSAAQTTPASESSRAVALTLRINGNEHRVHIDPRTTLLDCLRETVHLTGTKKGCDHGQCGACTVHVNGRRVNSCLTLAVMHDADEITTIEGLGTPEALHPMQAAFVAHDAYQCGYCTPGQIMSAVALLDEPCGPAEADVKELMSGNICRCGAYLNIVAAIQQVRGKA